MGVVGPLYEQAWQERPFADRASLHSHAKPSLSHASRGMIAEFRLHDFI